MGEKLRCACFTTQYTTLNMFFMRGRRCRHRALLRPKTGMHAYVLNS